MTPTEKPDDAVTMPSMDAAMLTALTPSLQPTGEHKVLPDGYCPDCCGAPCIKTWLNDGRHTIRHSHGSGLHDHRLVDVDEADEAP